MKRPPANGFVGTSLEIFSGAGGLALGVEDAGFQHLGLVEFNQDARATIKLNNENGTYADPWPLLEPPNIQGIDFRTFRGKVQIVAGGPPCQPFSIGGVHRGDLDHRNMFPEAIRCVREVEPEAFLFENVRGLTRPSFRPYVEYIAKQLRRPWLTRRDGEDWLAHDRRLDRATKSMVKPEGPEYTVDWRCVSCSDFGAPQMRERVLFVGFRTDNDVQWTWPSPTHSRLALLYDQYVTGEYWERHGLACRKPSSDIKKEVERLKFLGWDTGRKAWVTVRDAIGTLGVPAKIQDRVSIKHNQHVFIPGAKSYPGHSGSPLDAPAKALKAGVHGVPGGENMVVLDSGETRYFTVREAACLQGFPEAYLFSGAWGECMRQIGNALPSMVASYFASRIVDVFRGVRGDRQPRRAKAG